MKSDQSLLIKPLLTEKMLMMQEDARKYAFQVAVRANKIEIKHAVEDKFDVVVDHVQTIKVKGKAKSMNIRRGVTRGKRSDWKKAIVTLRDGYSIDFFQEQQG